MAIFVEQTARLAYNHLVCDLQENWAALLDLVVNPSGTAGTTIHASTPSNLGFSK